MIVIPQTRLEGQEKWEREKKGGEDTKGREVEMRKGRDGWRKDSRQ
jgi:hypothetical protein